MKKLKLLIIDALRWIALVLYVATFYVLGLVLYYLSKLVRILGFYLIFAPASAKAEFYSFWQVDRDIADILPKKE